MSAPRTGRRALLGGAAGLAVAGSAAPVAAAQADAELIGLCAEYVALDAAFCRAGEDVAAEEKGAERARLDGLCSAMVPRLHVLEELIADLPATTLAGVRAKARAALHLISGDTAAGTGPMDDEDWMIWSLLKDVLGQGA
jgi:hypothetical protein